MKEYLLKIKELNKESPPCIYVSGALDNLAHSGEPAKTFKEIGIKDDEGNLVGLMIEVVSENPLNSKQKDSLKPFYEIYEKMQL